MYKKLFLLTTVAGLMLIGCNEVDCCISSVIEADPSEIVLGGLEDATETLNLTCPISWQITGTIPEWLEVGPPSGTGTPATVTLTFKAKSNNTTGANRPVETLTFLAANGDKFLVTVTQIAMPQTFIVRYEPNRDPTTVNNMPADHTKTSGVPLTLSSNIPTHAGWYFELWNTEADGSGTAYDLGDSYTLDADLTLYAQWTDWVPMRTVEELAALATAVNGGNSMSGVKYKLVRNLDLTDYLSSSGGGYNAGRGWIAIGGAVAAERPFSGIFDGNGLTISGLYIDDNTTAPETLNVGLFGAVSGGTVQNLHVEIAAGGITNSGTGTLGGIAGFVTAGSTIQNCSVTGGPVASSTSYGYVGGIAAEVGSGSNSIVNCYTTVSVSGRAFVGGVVGYLGGSVINCVALNPSISSFGGGTTNFGRVSGNTTGGLTNNWANQAMTVLGSSVTDGTGSNRNGADCVAKPAESWWTTNANWNFTNIWTMGADGYPKLK
ncbi:MAG: InlB B-repeat-containing protein [Bacteroidales bacterium]|nr:InlB B-repeat-containing protein [Bacteroidales bacterium]